MGQTQRRLHEIAAPPSVLAVEAEGVHPFDAGRRVRGLPRGDALLHLDWHPGNLLVDEVAGDICGIVDWDNARSGHPLLDLARTHAMLTVDPALAVLSGDVRGLLAPFRDAWAAAYGPEASSIPGRCHRWAGLVILADLAPRYADRPELLAPLCLWTDREPQGLSRAPDRRVT